MEITHKSLVNEWDLLRTWLAESRSVLRIQRKLESNAQEWAQRNRPTGSEYLLGGTQLQETRAFVQLHRDDLSDLAQDYVAASRKSQNRLRFRTSMLIPLALIAGMAAHLLSRLVFPPAPQLPVTTEIQEDLTVAPGLWQKRTKALKPPAKQPVTPAESLQNWGALQAS